MMGRNGFSLVELSIVLVILGLLVGGILGGQSLIRAAELRRVPIEYQTYQTAVYSFREKYRALPGDFSQATRFWGNAETGGTGGECATGIRTAYTDGTQTCNGNGDGLVQANEMFRFWQHLSNAGLIDGRYTGVQGSGGTSHHEIGINCPASRISGGGWSIVPTPTGTMLWAAFTESRNATYIGGQTPDNVTRAPLLQVDELWSLDQKMDDGKPGTGIIRSRTWQGCSDAATRDDHETAEYALDYTGLCTPVIIGLYR